MADQKITLAEFDIDVDKLIRDTQSVKQRIDEIKAEMKEMTKANNTSSEAFINNAVSLRELNKEYQNQLKVLAETASAKGKIVPLEQQLDEIMGREVRTINDLRKQNSDLLKTRNNLNLNNAEHVKLLQQINAQYDENTALIKENVSQREREQMSVGGYTEAIKEAINQTGLFNGVTQSMNQVMTVTNNIYNLSKTEIKAYWVQMTTATTVTQLFAASLNILKVALIATGIGAIVVLLGSMIAYLHGSEKASNKFAKVLRSLGGVVQGLLKVLMPLGEFLVDTLVKGFDLAGKAATKFMDLLADGLQFIGLESASKGLRNFNDELGRSAKLAQDLADAEAQMDEAMRKSKLTQLQYQKEAEKLRQLRDDETKSYADRIAANEKLGTLLNEQIQQEKQLALQALAAANLRIAVHGRTTEALDAQAAAMKEIIDIEERITGQQSEQLRNRVTLQRDAANKAKEAQEKAQQEALKAQNEALDLFIAEQGIRARTLAEQLEIERSVSAKRKQILDDELKYGKISQDKYNAEIINMNNDLLRRQAELAEQNALRELEEAERRVDVEKEANKWLTEARLAALEEQEIALREKRAAYEALRFSEGLTTEQEYRDAIYQINADAEAELAKLRQDRLAAQREEQELDFQTQLLALQERNAQVDEIEKLMIEQKRQREIEAARQKYTDETLLAQAILNIETEAAIATQKIDETKNQAIYKGRADLLGAISNLIGQETVIGKAAAIAQATMNTYQAATEALKAPWPLGPIAAAGAIAQGLGSVRKIMGTGTNIGTLNAPQMGRSAQQILAPVLEAVPPFATGGKVTGGIPIYRSNGDNVLATLKVGEVVLNEKQQQLLGGDAVFRAIGVPGFASGGVVNAQAVQSTIKTQLDSVMLDSLTKAVQRGAALGTAVGAQKGLVDLSTNKNIDRATTFV